MSRHVGELILERVAEQYRKHPESWTQGAGSLRGWMEHKRNSGHPISDTPLPPKPGCIDTMIDFYAAGHGGENAANMARRMLYNYHGIAPQPDSIHAFNDAIFRKRADVIAFVSMTKRYSSRPAPSVQNLLLGSALVGSLLAAGFGMIVTFI